MRLRLTPTVSYPFAEIAVFGPTPVGRRAMHNRAGFDQWCADLVVHVRARTNRAREASPTRLR
jgi:hypothetical protein